MSSRKSFFFFFDSLSEKATRFQNDSCGQAQRTSRPDYRKLGVCRRDFFRKMKSEECLMDVKILREDLDNL